MTGRGLCTHVAIGLLILSTLSVTSCRRLNVGADLEDIEWVIVACHAEGFLQQWVAKLTPTSDRTLIARLMASINVAREVGPTSETAGDGFIVFKLKPAGIRAFNVVPWGGDREVEIRPAYLSSDLGRLLRRIGNDRVGWATGDSFPEFQVNEIRVHEAGRPMRSFDPGSGSYRPLADAAAEVVQAFDPRWCEPNYEHGEPALSSRHQRVPMFIFLLEKPIQLSKLVVCRAEGDPLVARVKYVAFSSSQFASTVRLLGFVLLATYYRLRCYTKN